MGVYSIVLDTRQAIANMLLGADDRMLVVIGLRRGSSDEAAFKLLTDTLGSLAPGVRAELVVVVSFDAALNMDPLADGRHVTPFLQSHG